MPAPLGVGRGNTFLARVLEQLELLRRLRLRSVVHHLHFGVVRNGASCSLSLELILSLLCAEEPFVDLFCADFSPRTVLQPLLEGRLRRVHRFLFEINLKRHARGDRLGKGGCHVVNNVVWSTAQ